MRIIKRYSKTRDNIVKLKRFLDYCVVHCHYVKVTGLYVEIAVDLGAG
ncbi:hypothetical protein [Caballeronia novacaledonica]|uniref:Uncharacterized protein n=1 Tax=Caballeronia novacaledonica TaxID=1544861 RepID=A0AA37MJC0_9BURK|nr:hypothetical protein [Caballeronia novacaledonica]GJH29293.1 hypothetical protein CBA19CS42_32275 [Caballeronia novacaledonica]